MGASMAEQLVTLATYATVPEAHIARGSLEAAGITAFVEDEHLVGTLWSIGNAVVGVKLKVNSADLDAAIEVLGETVEISDEDWQSSEPEEDPETNPASDDESTEEEMPRNAREQLIDRGVFSLVIGIIFIPIAFYGLWLVLCAAMQKEPLRTSHRRKLWVSLVMVMAIVCFIALFFAASLSRLRRIGGF
jgi:Putative prokaryotic signal transducing protein